EPAAAFEPAATVFEPALGAFLSILTLGLASDSGVNESSVRLTPLLALLGSAALFLLVPRPNSSPQNTPSASPAETTTGTTREVPWRTGRRGTPIGPIGGPPIGCIGPPIGGPIGYGPGFAIRLLEPPGERHATGLGLDPRDDVELGGIL